MKCSWHKFILVTVLLKPFTTCLHNSFKQQLNLSVEILQLDMEFIVGQDRKAYTICVQVLPVVKKLGFHD